MRLFRCTSIVAGLVVAMTLAALTAGEARPAAKDDNPMLTATVGASDGYTIALTQADGTKVTHLDPGTYTITVYDESTIHNFHLYGPGVNKVTSIFAVGESTWTVTFVDGYYQYKCDPHASEMHGAFTVGTGQPPAPPKKLQASVGPGATITVKSATGVHVTSCASGKWIVTVHDLSATQNFRLRGPGVNRSTGVKFRGTVRWVLTLRAGKYTYKSDTDAKLHGSFVAKTTP